MSDFLYLGVDCSTQSLKLIITDENSNIITSSSVNYASDLSKYNTTDGYIKNNLMITSPTIMFIEALDIALNRLIVTGVNMKNIKSISGSGQQHGSVWWKKGSLEILESLNNDSNNVPLIDLFKDAFTLDSPIWMDSSTTLECREIENYIGTSDEVALITGSICYERFTGPQIRKYFKNNRNKIKNTERISLISSFIPSLLIGNYAAIDYGDASGMNLMDLNNKNWSSKLLNATVANTEFTSEQLSSMLGDLCPSNKILGNINLYFQSKYGFSNDCKIVAFSGDNICALAAMGLHTAGDVGMSLGSSDTLFAVLKSPNPSHIGHIFCHPIEQEMYMALLCFKNGSLAREKIHSNWEDFNAKLENSHPIVGNLGSYYFEPEITPTVLKSLFVEAIAIDDVTNWDNYQLNVIDNLIADTALNRVRMMVESQFFNMRFHLDSIGLSNISRLFVTGGASNNKNILQIVADVFGIPVFKSSGTESAAMGGAMRANHALNNKLDCFQSNFEIIATPGKNSATYKTMMPMFKKLQEYIKSLI